ncbi:MAG: adenylate/guanylate cyclase domain-containing protein [Spirochaetota bacterium]
MRKANIFVTIIFVLLSCNKDWKQAPKAVNGVLDLTEWNFDKDGIVKLDGEWTFYWQKFYNFEDFRKAPQLQPNALSVLPGVWNQIELNGAKIGGAGYATYRLRVKLPADQINKIFGFYSLEQSTAYRITANGSPVGGSGKVAANQNEYIPETRSSGSNFYLNSDEIIFVVQITNYSHRDGGVWHSFVLGNSEDVLKLISAKKHREIILMSIILIIALYHLAIYYFRTNEKTPLWFSIFCLLTFARTGVTGEKQLLDFISMPFRLHLTIEYLTFYLALPVWLHYVYHLFYPRINQRLLQVSYAISLLFAATLFLPVHLFTHAIPLFQGVFLTGLIIFLGILIKLSVQGVPYSGFTLLASLLLAVLSLNDILYTRLIINTGFLVSYGFIFLIFSQAVILAINFSKSFSTNETLLKASSRFIPASSLDELNRSDFSEVKPGDYVEKKVTVMFTDIRNFTSIAEKMPPGTLLKLLNSYLSLMEPVIRRHHGYIDKYIGDAIMAIFPRKADDAVAAAVEMQVILREKTNEFAALGFQNIKTATGIHYGRVVLGVVGNEDRLDVTVLSDAVNLAARLEGQAKKYDAAILISEDTAFELEDINSFICRPVDTAVVKGRSNETVVYEVLSGDVERVQKEIKEYISEYTEYFMRYRAGEKKPARDGFSDLAKRYPQDKVVTYLLDQMDENSVPA